MMSRVKPIILVGMMGSGKSTVAKILAHRYDCAVWDSDVMIENATQRSIPFLFRHRGVRYFRLLERRLVTACLRRLRGSVAVVSLGGGAFCHDDVRRLARLYGEVVWLKTPPFVLVSRTTGTNRPLLQGARRYRQLRNLHGRRVAHYAQAHHHIDTRRDDCHAIARLIGSRLHHD